MNVVGRNGVPSDRLLSIYLNDHLSGATAGVQLFERACQGQRDTSRRSALSYLTAEVVSDRDALLGVMARLGIQVAPHRVAAGWIGEKLGRLKLNGTILRRSPLSDLVELEAMLLGIQGKACLWRSLRVVAATDERLDASDFEALGNRAGSQISEVEAMRQSAAAALRP